MRILLVIASNIVFEDGSRWEQRRLRGSYAPTTLATLAALVPEELQAEVLAVDEMVDAVPEDFAGADLVGISAMTCSARRAYQLADKARAQGRTTVLGGYHPTYMPDEALQHADAVVVGFAEEAWPALLKDYAAGRLQRRYSAPWEARFQSPNKAARHELIHWRRYPMPATVEATRGCPNACTFCVVPEMHERRYVCREPDGLIAEIAALGSRHVGLLDANPGASPEFTRDVIPRLGELGIHWYGSAALPQAGDREWVRAAAQSGLSGVVVGFETVNAESLAGSAKGFNKVSRYADTCALLHDHGIAVLGTFMFGFDQDDESVFERTAELVMRARIDLVLYSVYTPFPGTPAYARLQEEGRILTDDWNLYDARHAVFRPARMSAEELREGLLRAWKQTYSVLSILRRVRVGAATPIILGANLGFRVFSRTFGVG